MQHDQLELDNVSRSVIRDIEDREDAAKLAKLIQRACRHYAEHMEPITMENQRAVRGPLDDISISHSHLNDGQRAVKDLGNLEFNDNLDD